MSDPLYKLVNVLDDRTGMPVIDVETKKPVQRLMQMSDEEAAAFEAERAAQASAEDKNA